ncbi:hypothetical protein Fot_32291 [Forsythia ovata]|uniref:Uncharacterized protein n=1 Tax=Forsythia ovata TaxID=205694 RepID=A0ABD1T7F6_9LAMI
MGCGIERNVGYGPSKYAIMVAVMSRGDHSQWRLVAMTLVTGGEGLAVTMAENRARLVAKKITRDCGSGKRLWLRGIVRDCGREEWHAIVDGESRARLWQIV